MDEERRQRVLSLTGVLPLTVYVIFHLFETGAATGGRGAFADRLSGSGGGVLAVTLEIVLVLVPLGVHAALGIVATVRDRSPEPDGYRSSGLRIVQRGTGLGLLAFLVFHLGHSWVAKLGGADGSALYDRLRDSIGTPVYVLCYVFGVTCVAFHLALGIGAFASRWGLVHSEGGRRVARGVGVLLGVAVWIAWLNTLSHFAVGRAFLGGGP